MEGGGNYTPGNPYSKRPKPTIAVTGAITIGLIMITLQILCSHMSLWRCIKQHFNHIPLSNVYNRNSTRSDFHESSAQNQAWVTTSGVLQLTGLHWSVKLFPLPDNSAPQATKSEYDSQCWPSDEGSLRRPHCSPKSLQNAGNICFMTRTTRVETFEVASRTSSRFWVMSLTSCGSGMSTMEGALTIERVIDRK